MDLKAILEGHSATAPWYTYLQGMDAPDVPLALPSADDLPAVLLELAVPHEDIDVVVALLPVARRDDVWWVIERAARSLLSFMGQFDRPFGMPDLPTETGALGRYFYLFVFVTVLPYVRAFHAQRGINQDVSRQTFADLGRNMAVHRRRHDIGGLHAPGWMMHHFTGNLYALGRLQFERAQLDERTGQAIAAAGLPYGPGDPVLSVHIPAFSGAMSPSACNASFGRARAFFQRHFPDETHDIVTCHSWLLDEQLADYLPAESNIVQFMRRFTTIRSPEPNNNNTLLFVFGKTEQHLDQLPQNTRLERIVVEHIRAGKSWHSGMGWMRLP